MIKPDNDKLTAEAVPAARNPRVRIEMVHQLYDQAVPPLVITLINTGLMAAAISFVSDPLASMMWFGAMVIVVGMRFGLVVLYRKRRPQGEEVLTWAWPYAMGAGLAALVLGGSVFLLPQDAMAHHVFVAFVLAGMIAGGLPVLAPFLPAYYLYLFPMTLPLAGRMFEMGTDLAYFMLAMIPLYILFMTINSKRYRDAMAESYELRFRNDELVSSISEEKRRIEHMAEELTIEVEERRQIESELFVAKEHAEAASIAKSQFLANMSHEIRTPMNGVIGMLQLLEDSELDEDQEACVRTASNSAASLLVVLNSILDFSKIESGRLELESVEFDLHDLAREVVGLHKVQADGKALDLNLSVSSDVPHWVKSDPTRIRQVLSNLVNNALKFTNSGSVSVSLSRVEDELPVVRCEVRDTGIGIPKEKQSSLFRAFTQADGSMTRQYGGTGLGLAISKQLIELLGGKIGFDSEAGKGTCFFFTFPVIPVSAPVKPAQLSETRIPKTDIGKGRVLLVDDEPINQQVALKMLAQFGADVMVANDGEEALGLIKAERFDLVLMDFHMPGMDGVEATKALRLWEKENDVEPNRVVALTADVVAEAQQKCRDAGMDDILEKPIRLRTLGACLDKWLKKGD